MSLPSPADETQPDRAGNLAAIFSIQPDDSQPLTQFSAEQREAYKWAIGWLHDFNLGRRPKPEFSDEVLARLFQGTGPSHCNVCVVEPDVAGEPQPPFAGQQILVVFVQMLNQDEGTSLTQAVGHLISFHGPKWLESEGYALDGGKRPVHYFECYADARTVDEIWIHEQTADARWRPFTPGCRELSAFERQTGCSLPGYHEADEPCC